MADVLDRTARQVRLPGGIVHKLTSARLVDGVGRCYRTRCGRQLDAPAGAVLTTRPVGCADCTTAAATRERTKEFVEAVLGEAGDG